MLRTLSISRRIGLMLGVVFGFVAILVVGFAIAAWQAKELAAERSAEAVEAAVADKLQLSTQAVASTLGAQLAGLQDPRARHDAVRKAVQDFRYDADRSGYFFIYQGTTVVTVPPRPELTGKDLAQTKDANGILFVTELAARAREGGGFVRYVFNKPGAGPTPKLSYATSVPGTDMWIGTGVYLDNLAALRASVAGELQSSMQKSFMYLLIPFAILLLTVVLPLATKIASSVIRPLSRARDAMREIAGGEADLTQRLDEEGQDELAELARSFNQFLGNLAEIVRGVSASSNSMTASANELAASSERIAVSAADVKQRSSETTLFMGKVRAQAERIASTTDGNSAQVAGVAVTTEQLSGSARDAAGSTVEVSASIDAVAAALEELNASFNEVSRSCAESAQASQASTLQLEAVKTEMAALREAAKEVGSIVGLINDVADQTNLLALNATIEAASAGDAGRGFAVVASEVKALAQQTAKATDEIAARVQQMRDRTATASASVQIVGDKSQELERATETIASAVEEQTATLSELNRMLAEGAAAVRSMTATMSSISGGVSSLASSSEGLATGARGVADSVRQISGSADGISTNLQALEARSVGTSKEVDQVKDIAQALLDRARSLEATVQRFRA